MTAGGDDSLTWIGRIVKTQGIAGQVRVSPGDSQTFPRGRRIYVEDPEGRRKAFTVEASRPRKEGVVVSLEGVARVEAARELVGSSVYVEKQSLEPLPSDEFYWHQLRGLKVQTEEGILLGRLEQVFSTGSNDVFVVRDEGKEILLPATDEVVAGVDLKGKVMTIRLLQGLLTEDDL